MLRTACIALLLLALSGCTQGPAGRRREQQGGPRPHPALGACRALTPDDIAQASNATAPVDCSAKHTAETFTVGTFPADLAAGRPGRPRPRRLRLRPVPAPLPAFLGGDESLVLRSTMTWAWFRPSKDAWADGAHWFRCDVVGGGEQSKSFVALPEDRQGPAARQARRPLAGLRRRPQRQRLGEDPVQPPAHLARGHHDRGRQGRPTPTPATGSSRSAPATSAPGRSGAWLNYPVDYDYGYTWFHEAEWKAGNRRSICWAKTTE